jgi:hypothetical protein
MGKLPGNAQRLQDSLPAILKEFWKVVGKSPKEHRWPIGKKAEMPSGYRQKCGSSDPFSLQCRIFLYIYWKSKEPWNFKNIQRFLSYFCPFQQYYF